VRRPPSEAHGTALAHVAALMASSQPHAVDPRIERAPWSHDAGASPPGFDAREGVPGTGLPGPVYSLLLLVSVALFVFWGGPFWRAAANESHLPRFVASYLLVIPLTAAALLTYRRLTWARQITATATLWGLKLLITAALYIAIPRSPSNVLAPAHDTRHGVPAHAVAAGTEYAPARTGFAAGTLQGRVSRGGVPVEGAVVLLVAPPSGAALHEAKRVELTIPGPGARAEVLRSHDEMVATNTDGRLHTLHFVRDGRTVRNEPLPGGSSARPIAAPEPGIYDIRCDNHPGEHARLVVVDHPYVTRTDAAGRFELRGVAAAEVVVRVLDGVGAGQQRAVVVVENEASHVDQAL
jgi:hypothetical protein